jgi:hypothetical protein
MRDSSPFWICSSIVQICWSLSQTKLCEDPRGSFTGMHKHFDHFRVLSISADPEASRPTQRGFLRIFFKKLDTFKPFLNIAHISWPRVPQSNPMGIPKNPFHEFGYIWISFKCCSYLMICKCPSPSRRIFFWKLLALFWAQFIHDDPQAHKSQQSEHFWGSFAPFWHIWTFLSKAQIW